MKKILLVFFILQLVWAVNDRNVIICVIDGVRYTEAFDTMWDKDQQNDTLPNIWALTPNGTLCTKLYVGNPEKLTETNPSHATLLTGTWQNLYNDMTLYKSVKPGEDPYANYVANDEPPNMPTLFEYFRKETGATQNAAYLVVGKGKLGVMAYSTHPEYGEKYAAAKWTIKDQYASFSDEMYMTNYLMDNVTWLRVQEVLEQYHPQLMLINLPLCDYIGHKEFSGDTTPVDDPSPTHPSLNAYQVYSDAIRNADRIVGELWKKIESDSVYAGKTDLIVLTDHGRHSNRCLGPKEHDGKLCTRASDPLKIGVCDSVSHLMFFAIGPSFKEGHVSGKLYTLRDIAPTIGKIMALPTPLVQGQVMQDILKNHEK